MSDIMFYHLMRRSFAQTLHLLAAKCLARDWRVLVLSDHDERADELDRALWEVDAADFLPHGRDNDDFASEQPILIACEDKGLIKAKAHIYINRFELPDNSEAERLMYLFQDHDETGKNTARDLWRTALNKNHTIAYWQEQPDGRFTELKKT